eukprot:gnl/TRDRNA2_/TRDRNA2_156090_c0_seq6.p1 gnl/TRDRNA2_/TRDRNA2_156090_c0~~gnl/TRDRNA2_/TRDRNA2_156090_c0_seq6.p1  ORF type:complete len:123 (+),score=6.33 gnl/TRDRNA2_/TRDRNA2_156090_c0_seq6:44-412(+)
MPCLVKEAVATAVVACGSHARDILCPMYESSSSHRRLAGDGPYNNMFELQFCVVVDRRSTCWLFHDETFCTSKFQLRLLHESAPWGGECAKRSALPSCLRTGLTSTVHRARQLKAQLLQRSG